MHQIISQWEWEEQMAEERAEAVAQHKLSLRRDYGWHRAGWRWEVRLSWLNDAGEAVYTERIIPLLFWRKNTAALVSNAIFCAYEDGRSVQRKTGSFAPADGNTEAG